LAKIHVAVKRLGIDDVTYEDILREQYGVATAKALSIKEMEQLVSFFIDLGWVPVRRQKHGPSQIAALQERIWQLTDEIPDGRKQLPSLCKTILGTEAVAWCKDWQKLTRLVAVMEKIKRRSRDGDPC
jgi:phage gp16-like protein